MSVETIFAAAAQKPLAERPHYLEQACGPDGELRRKVERLLTAHDAAGEFLEAPSPRAAGTIDDTPISEKPGSMIGPYKLKEQIGEGGFGLVFVAEQQEPVKRKVALKVIKPGMDSREVVARFARPCSTRIRKESSTATSNRRMCWSRRMTASRWPR